MTKFRRIKAVVHKRYEEKAPIAPDSVYSYFIGFYCCCSVSSFVRNACPFLGCVMSCETASKLPKVLFPWTCYFGYVSCGRRFQTRPWDQNSYGKGFGKQKGVNEMSDWSQVVWDLNGILALRAAPSKAESAFSGCASSVAACDSAKPIRCMQQCSSNMAMWQ